MGDELDDAERPKYVARLFVRGPSGELSFWKQITGSRQRLEAFLKLAPLVAPHELLLCCLDPFEPDFRSGVVCVAPVPRKGVMDCS